MLLSDLTLLNLFFDAVICFCFTGKGRIVMLQKRRDNKYYPGLWGIPGGKIALGESPLDAVVREVHEETGNKLPGNMFQLVLKTNHKHFFKNGCERGKIYFKGYTFISSAKFKTIVLDETEHMGYLAVSPKLFLKADPRIMIPDTQRIYQMLRKRGKF